MTTSNVNTAVLSSVRTGKTRRRDYFAKRARAISPNLQVHAVSPNSSASGGGDGFDAGLTLDLAAPLELAVALSLHYPCRAPVHEKSICYVCFNI